VSAILVCPECDKKLRVPDTVMGKAFRCPACKALIPPASEPDSPAPSRSVKQSPSPRSAAVPSRGRPAREEEPEDDFEPEDERPVRPKPSGQRRPKPKKSSAGLIIGLAVAGGVVLLLFVGIGVGLFLYFNRSRTIPEAEWQSFSPPNSGCTILIPGTPVFRSQTRNGLTGNLYGVERDNGKTAFGVTVMNLGPNPLKPSALELGTNAMRDEIMRRTNGKATITSETSITLAGIPGYEFQAKFPGGGTFIDRFYLAKIDGMHRSYTVFAGSEHIPLDKGDAAHFFDSFKITASATAPDLTGAAGQGGMQMPPAFNPPPANPQPNPPPGIRRPRQRRRP